MFIYNNRNFKPFLKPLKSKGDPATIAMLYLSKIHHIYIEKLKLGCIGCSDCDGD
jgi:hypothetical protein